MQIVIEIDENLYTRLFDNGVDNYDDAVDMAKAIRKGKPLPEGHGRLIDADNLPLNAIDDANYGSNYIRIAPTIIEADKESEGKLSWLGKNCKDCGNEKCKKLGTLPKGYDCALWQSEREE